MMKRIMTVLLAAVMIFCGLNVLAEEEVIEVAATEEALTEEVAEAPAEEAPAAETPAEQPAAEEPAAAPAQEPAAEKPAEEKPAEKPAEQKPAEKPAEEKPTEKPVEEKPAEKPAEKAPAAEKPAEEKPAEKPAEEKPAAEPVQEPAAEVPAEKQAEEKPAAEPAKEEPVAEEPAVVETEEAPADEEAPASFTGKLTVRCSQNPVETGTTTFLRATVRDENMGYSIHWELETASGWTAISGANGEVYTFAATMPAGSYNFRAVLTAEDGTVLTAGVTLKVVDPETEDLSGTAPAEELPEAEEPAEEVPAEEQADTEEPAEEIPAEELPVTEEDNAEETEIIEDYETALGLPEAEPEPEKKVSISVDRNGDKLNMTSRIEGFDGYEIRYQWECNKHDGAGFQNVNGANGSTYSIEATSETLKWEWRLSVYF